MEALQQSFLQQIEQKLQPGRLLVRELMDATGISKSEAYNKISGKSLLTTRQLQMLCNKFGVNFTIPGNSQHNASEVNFMSFRNTGISVQDYVESLRKLLVAIAAAPNGKLSCATDDIPIFHLFGYPELTAFKLHFWQMRSINNAPFVLDFENWDSTILKTTRELHTLYQSIPSVEIWTKSSLLNTLDQIRYAKSVGIISNEQGRIICRQLRSALAGIEKCAVNRSKSGDGKVLFDWYFYEIIGTITYLAEMNGNLMTFLRFNTFNTIQAYNQPICHEVQHWMHKLVADSTGFSGQGSVYRNRYLASAYESCDEIERAFA